MRGLETPEEGLVVLPQGSDRSGLPWCCGSDILIMIGVDVKAAHTAGIGVGWGVDMDEDGWDDGLLLLWMWAKYQGGRIKREGKENA